MNTINDYGRVPPQNVQAEEVVLGTCMVSTDAALEIADSLHPDMFYKESHRKIYTAIITCLKRHGDCDMVVVTSELMTSGNLESCGGPLYITKLCDRIVTDKQADIMATLVKQSYLLREYIRIGVTLSNTAFAGDLDETMQFAESELFKLSSTTQKKDFQHIAVSMDELLLKIYKIANKEINVLGVPSGYTGIDRYTSGWQNGDLIIVAGRPSMGKTAFALELARGSAMLGFPAGIFSLEMSEEQVTNRYLSGETGLSNTELKNGEVLDYHKICVQSNEIAKLPIYIDDTSALTLFELRSKAKKMIIKHGVKLLVVDYLQLMKADAGSREQEVSQISRGLKAIAKELSVPIIALSQLNRQVEDRADKKPRLADLRESGAIEQDADLVLFLLRPAYYHIQTITLGNSEIDTNKLILIDIAKHRNGALGIVPLRHNESMSRIISFDDDFAEESVPY